MGKKPVLGLVGLCIGLTLTGCKDSGGGWWASRKEKTAAPVARVDKPANQSSATRTRTVTDQTISRQSPVKSPYNMPVDSHDVPPSTAAESTVKNVKAEDKVEKTTVVPEHEATVVEKKIAPAELHDIVIPPAPPPMKVTEEVPTSKSTAPAEVEKVISPTAVKEPVQPKSVTVPDVMAEPRTSAKPGKVEEVPAPITTPVVPAPMPELQPPVNKPAPGSVPSPLPPGDVTPAPEVKAPPAVPEVKAPSSVPEVVPSDSKSGPDLVVPMPPQAPSK